MRSVETSKQMFASGARVIPDSVSSPMRAFRQVGGQPLCIASASGATVTDVDGNTYVDFLNAFGAQLVGHAHPHVIDAISRQARSGTVFGLTSPLEHQLAERIVASTPALEQIRFVCSGTEAVMTATRIARSHTKRSLIVKFLGSYHGHSDALLADPATSGAAAKGSTHGIPDGLSRDTLTCHYNDIDGLSTLFDEQGDMIAAVLVEPFATNMGFVRPAEGFLAHIRSLCDRHGALFIMDEVVTGFRFTFGGVCQLLGVRPDLVTFGKIIGGGTSIGAYAGKKHLMQHVAIGGSVFQSGTFAANPLTMAAGNATLDILNASGFYQSLEERGAILQTAIEAAFAARHIPFLFTRFGALAGVAFRNSRQPLTSYRDVKTQMYAVHADVHQRMLDQGFLMPPSLEEPVFISAAHGEEHLQGFAHALAVAIEASLQSNASANELASA